MYVLYITQFCIVFRWTEYKGIGIVNYTRPLYNLTSQVDLRDRDFDVACVSKNGLVAIF